MAPPVQPPFALDLVLRELVQPSAAAAHSGCTELSAHDVQTATTATARAWGFKGARLSLSVLRQGLVCILEDLPFLAGRWAADVASQASVLHFLWRSHPLTCPPVCHPMRRPPRRLDSGGRLAGLRLGSLRIQHTGAGALLTAVAVPEASVDCMAPHTWPVAGRPLSDPAVPFYIEPLDLGRR